ncbi:transposase [Streptomyces sp. ISL-111]|uniref:transposase n=1 Tax=Streptomyces sp. NPDC058629 TaxID=3346565 RepID=UPI002034B9A7|nr:transposase [Streptomyces sp. ISL-111]
MALSQHDLLRLLESLRSADGLELVRNVAERMLQELIEAEATARIGAEWNEHTETRTALRNGHRDKTLSTQAGDTSVRRQRLLRARPDSRQINARTPAGSVISKSQTVAAGTTRSLRDPVRRE